VPDAGWRLRSALRRAARGADGVRGRRQRDRAPSRSPSRPGRPGELGSPEGELALAQAVVYLAVARRATPSTWLRRGDGGRPWRAVARGAVHLRNAPTRLMKELGTDAITVRARRAGRLRRGETISPTSSVSDAIICDDRGSRRRSGKSSRGCGGSTPRRAERTRSHRACRARRPADGDTHALRTGRRSDNVEDRRGESGRGGRACPSWAAAA